MAEKIYSLDLSPAEARERLRLEAYCRGKGLWRPGDRLRVRAGGGQLEASVIKQHQVGKFTVDEVSSIPQELSQIEYLKSEIASDSDLPKWQKESFFDLLVAESRRLKANGVPPPEFDIQSQIDPRLWSKMQLYFEKKGGQGPSSRVESTAYVIENEIFNIKSLQDAVWNDVELTRDRKDEIYQALVEVSRVLRSLLPAAQKADEWRYLQTGSPVIR
jgi:hypothetical protein